MTTTTIEFEEHIPQYDVWTKNTVDCSGNGEHVRDELNNTPLIRNVSLPFPLKDKRVKTPVPPQPKGYTSFDPYHPGGSKS